VSGAARLELRRPRDIGALFADGLGVYLRHGWTFLSLAAAIVVPAELIVSGIGLRQLSSPYEDSESAVEVAIPSIVSFLVVAPLVTATCIYALHAVAEGRKPSAWRAITAGLEAFAPIFFAIVLAAVGIALGLAVLIVPGVYLAVRWFFVPQAVVIENARGPEALRKSGALVTGSWWRTFGIVLAANLAAAVPGLILLVPFEALAQETDRELFSLIAATLTETVTGPFVALVSTLLYYDLSARRQRVV
jgi:Uncharacterised protein family (UPF0259)